MKHLSSDEFVDFIEGALAEGRASHLARCEPCRRQADELRETLAETRDFEVPEPSPLYWDRLSSRVRAAVAAEPRLRRSSAWTWRPAYGLVAALVVVVLMLAAVWRPGSEREAEPSSGIEASREVSRLEPLADFEGGPTDETWEAVIAVSSDLQWDEAEEAGFGVRPGTADTVLSTLTDVERLELARILRTELSLTDSM